jgi:hypothetical protein
MLPTALPQAESDDGRTWGSDRCGLSRHSAQGYGPFVSNPRQPPHDATSAGTGGRLLPF